MRNRAAEDRRGIGHWACILRFLGNASNHAADRHAILDSVLDANLRPTQSAPQMSALLFLKK